MSTLVPAVWDGPVAVNRYRRLVPETEVVFETHSTTEDNERGVATGWLPGKLSAAGRDQAGEMGERRRADRIAAVFTSDLARAVETVSIAFVDSGISILHDWRRRECDDGDRNGRPADELERGQHVDVPHPNGESWRGLRRGSADSSTTCRRGGKAAESSLSGIPRHGGPSTTF